MPRLSISTLGTFSVVLDGKPLRGFRSVKIQALLVYLATESDIAHRRESLIELFWPNYDFKSANTNFRQALSRLQKALGNKSVTPPFLIITRQTVQWNKKK